MHIAVVVFFLIVPVLFFRRVLVLMFFVRVPTPLVVISSSPFFCSFVWLHLLVFVLLSFVYLGRCLFDFDDLVG